MDSRLVSNEAFSTCSRQVRACLELASASLSLLKQVELASTSLVRKSSTNFTSSSAADKLGSSQRLNEYDDQYQYIKNSRAFFVNWFRGLVDAEGTFTIDRQKDGRKWN